VPRGGDNPDAGIGNVGYKKPIGPHRPNNKHRGVIQEMPTFFGRFAGAAAGLALGLALASPALAADKLKIAISQKGLWDTAVAYFAVERGFFKAENLDVSYIFTSGGSETIQTLVSGSTDIIIGTGILGVISAYAKGAPIVIVRSQILGAPEAFWIVRSNSPIQSAKDFNGKKVGYSRPGSTTNLILLTMMRQFNVKPELVSVGGPAASRTQLMTGQIDAGYSLPPYNLDIVNSKEVRIVFRATDVPELQKQTSRVNVAHKDLVTKHADVVARFNRAYDKALAWMYDKPAESIPAYAAYANVPEDIAKEVPQFYPRELVAKTGLVGTDRNIKDAVDSKFIAKPLTEAEAAGMVKIVE
jgi:NitT/TauT family transport system substrate-binding protein